MRMHPVEKWVAMVLALLACVILPVAPALAAADSPAVAAQSATPGAAATPAPAAGQSVTAGPPAPVKPPDAVAGKAIYSDKCAPCHGTLGDGKGEMAAKLSVNPTNFTDFPTMAGISLADFFNVVKNGRMARMMPPWNKVLTDQQMWDTVAYAWSVHTSQAEVDAGKKVYEANCASCHGADGKGQNGAPDLTAFSATSTKTQNDWLKTVSAGRGQMPGFAGKLQDADQRAVLEYARSLSFTRLFPGPLPTGQGVITGTVINATTGKLMANLPITLTVFDNQTLSTNRPAMTDASGKFRYEGLPTDRSLEYQISTNYPANVPYATDPTAFVTNTVALSLPLHVFETTSDGAGIRADQVHLIIQPDPGTKTLQVAELAVFSLDSDKTFVGDQNKTVLRIDLPAGAQQLTVSDGEMGKRFRPTDKGFVDTLPLPPGSSVRQLLFRYLLPYTSDKLDLTSALGYPVTNLNALIADMGEKVASTQLKDQGARQTQMGNFRQLTGQSLPANQAVTLQFSQLNRVTDSGAASGAASPDTATPAPSATDRWLLIALVAVVGIGVGFLAAWPLMRRRGAPAAAGIAGEGLDEAGLIDALARLDLAHEAHELSDADYRDQRVRLKAKLLDIMQQDGGQ